MAASGRGLGFLGMARCWVKKNGTVAKENDWHTKTDVAKTKHARNGNALKIAEIHQLAAKNRSRTNCYEFRKVNNYNVFIVWTLRAIPVLVELTWLSISACSATRALDFDRLSVNADLQVQTVGSRERCVESVEMKTRCGYW